ncbi:putative steryl acetyl hydrolase mug81 [[Candida] railenensis]|uniref:Steryl acetyl hydrolase mug81 n=1 Tax=[Candida] railenensis TaxID=45579 RepID=A0A9P0QNK6_9ASCO|nr:putative steryl acetyl hydrolase mug81 [[Candida] railenensis]
MTTIPSITLVLFAITLPIRIIYLIASHYILGSGFQKYQGDLINHIKLSCFKSSSDFFTSSDYKLIGSYKIGKVFERFRSGYPHIVSKLSNYGEEYDSRSTWLVKSSSTLKDSNDPIIVYLHGGGYRLQFTPPQMQSLISTYFLLQPDKKEKLSVLVLDYRLSISGDTFPAPIEDLHQTYQNLTVRDGNTNIIFLGDSAGGNLALTYLQHLKSLNTKDVVYPSNLVLVAPWVRVKPTEEQYVPGSSWYDNRPRDLLQYRRFSSYNNMKHIFGDSDVKSVKVSPLSSPFNVHDWEDIPTIKNNTLVICGEFESFRDDILEFSKLVFGCPFFKVNSEAYNSSDGTYNPSIHEYQSETENGKVGFRLFVEPMGIHDSAFMLESAVDKLVKDDKVEVDELDDKYYFGIKRMVNFLNEVL